MYNGPQPIPPSGGAPPPTPAYIVVYLTASGKTVTSAVQALVPFDTMPYSKNMSLNADGSVNITVNGIYNVQYSGMFTTSCSGSIYYMLYKNSTVVAEFTETIGSYQSSFAGGFMVSCVAGDKLSMQIMQTSGSSKTWSNGSALTFMHINKIN